MYFQLSILLICIILRIDTFELWYWRRLLRVPWTSRRTNQSVLKEINPEHSMMLKLKLQYFGHLMQISQFIGKYPDAGKDWGQEEKMVTEGEMVGWHHQCSGHELRQSPGHGEGHRSLECSSPWCCEESHMTQTLNNSNIKNTNMHENYRGSKWSIVTNGFWWDNKFAIPW